jgi:uroporphyrinogen decarboxylase
MTGYERFGSLAAGKLPDRVPVVCNLLEQGAEELGMSIKEYYSKPDFVAEAQLCMQQKYGYDCLWGMTNIAAIAEILGCRNVIYSASGPPNIGHMIIKDYSDIEKLDVSGDIRETQALQSWLRIIRLLKAESQVPVLSPVVGSFTLPSILMGMEKWMELLFFGPETLRDEFLAKCSIFNKKFITALREGGIDLINYMNPMSTKDFLDFKTFEKLCLPSILQDFDGIGTDGIIYFNGGGEINPILDSLINNTGIGIYYLHPYDDVEEAGKIIDGRALFSGVINDIKLLRWTAGDIEAEVERIMTKGMRFPGFFFGTLVMPYMIPKQNIVTLMNSAFSAGKY